LSNLVVRILSAMAMGLVGFSALVLNLHSRWAVIAMVLSLGAWEYSRMVSIKLTGPSVAWLPAILVGLCTLPHLPGFTFFPSELWIWGIGVVSVLGFTLLGFKYAHISIMAPWIYLQLFGCAYFGLYAMGIYALLNPMLGWQGIFPLLMVQLAISMADTGAYVTGKAFGKNKLCPTISAGKTIEGAVGGAILTTSLVIALGPVLLGTHWAINLGLGLVLSATAILGDLFISILKRYTEFKDSSHLIPGHGGILDRFDSLFFSAPVAVFYLHIFRP
jgi:phosphatidate cytidylyltransferase